MKNRDTVLIVGSWDWMWHFLLVLWTPIKQIVGDSECLWEDPLPGIITELRVRKFKPLNGMDKTQFRIKLQTSKTRLLRQLFHPPLLCHVLFVLCA